MNKPFADLASAAADRTGVGPALLLAGMHRSGSSALARVISLLGAELPRTLMPAGQDNPKGFWESDAVAALNDELLAEVGAAWDDPLVFLARREELKSKPSVLSRIGRVIAAEYALRGPTVIKDPRIALVLDAWLAAAARERLAPRVVIPFRNPLEVAASLNARNGFAYGRSLLLWLSYNLAAEKSSRGAPRAFVHYAELLADWRAVLQRLEHELETRLPTWTPAAEIEVDAFLSRTDQHHVSPPGLLGARADVVSWVKQAYDWMLAAASNEASDASALDAIAAEFAASTRVFAPVIAEQAATLTAARVSTARVLEEKAAAEQALTRLEAEKRALEARRDVLASDAEINRTRADALEQESRERAMQLEAARALADEREKRIVRLEGQVRAHAESAEKLEIELKAQLSDNAGLTERLEQLRAEMERLQTELEALDRRAAESEARLAATRVALEQAADALRGASAREGALRRSQWMQRPRARKRAARFFRTPVLRPLLRRLWPGRALVLLSSGLYIPQDGPGGRAILGYARGAPGAPQPHPLFDDAWYRARDPSIRGFAALHYLWHGDREGRDPHPLFASAWYREQNGAALAGWKLTTLEHYLLRGAQAGAAPHPLFDADYYLRQARDLAETGANPLAHYLREGWRQGLDPHPLFRTAWYYEQYPDVRTAGVPALAHFVVQGAADGRDPHPLFSTTYYLETNADVRAAGINPLAHYVTQGWRDGRRPNPHFDPTAYLRAHPEAARARVEPLAHYMMSGADAGDALSADAAAYERAPHEVLEGVTQLEAWLRAGAPAAADAASAAPARLDVLPQAASFDAFAAGKTALADNYDWPAYERLAAAIRTDERRRIETARHTPGQLIEIGAGGLASAAAKLRFEAPAQPEVSIVIPVYNQAKYTLECLASLARTLDGARAEIIVIDDASQDETQRLVGAIPGVRYVRNEENLGFLRTVNKAAALARGETLVILNNDTQVCPGWLAPLLEALADPSIGVAAPKMLFPNGRLQEAGAKLRPDGEAQMIGLFDDPDLPRYGYDRDVDYVSGACIAIRRGDFEALGGFDESFAPAYCEDSDLCLRVRAAGKRVRYVASSQIYHHLSVTSDSLPGDYKMRQVRRNQQLLVERWGEELEALNQVRVISFYLPQFHAIPENDRWWGAGFTEWRNVSKALPNFVGHYQPHQPAELGFYDLSQPDVMQRQADLARAYGVGGFCYYYYWFAGRRVLEAPLERMLASGKPDMPFCLCWANENWTRTWDGQAENVLLEQHYSDADDAAVITDMARFFAMPGYIRINGKPLVVVYRPQLFPDARRTAETWRRVCREAGLGEIYLAMVEVFEHARTYPVPRAWGSDASIEFPPSHTSSPINPGRKLNAAFKGVVSDYSEIARRYMSEPLPAHTRFRGAMPCWDNTPRRQNAPYVFHNATPGAFQAWLEAAIEQTRQQNFGDERIVFVNAWNEWAEGAHLEPDLRFGRGWLEAVRNAHLAGMQLTRTERT